MRLRPILNRSLLCLFLFKKVGCLLGDLGLMISISSGASLHAIYLSKSRRVWRTLSSRGWWAHSAKSKC